MRVDLAINTDTRLGQGGTANFTVRGYGRALTLLLDKYGRKLDQNGQVIQEGIIDNLMAWNEPQYRGSGRKSKCGDDPTVRTNNGNPLKRRPLKAAQLWFQAMAACFPDPAGAPFPGDRPAELARCGHRTANGTWEPGHVVAGDYSGYTQPYPRTVRGRRRDYIDHYRDEIERNAKNLGSIGYRALMPRVWSFHDYGDFKRFAIGNRRRASKPPILNRFVNLYNSEPYEYVKDGRTQKPEIWMTEGGVNYRFNCRSLADNEIALEDFCAQDPSNVALLGMRRQAQTMAFFLKTFANTPRVRRVYYYDLVTAGECNPNKPRRAPLYCPLSEFGLLGARDDDLYAESTESGMPPFVIPKGGTGPIEPNNNRYSYPGERRFAYCLVRDRKPSEVRKPNRMNRASCPAGPS